MELPVPNRQTFFLGGFFSAVFLGLSGWLVANAATAISDLWHDAQQFDEADQDDPERD